jgi:hypothetical protein
VRGEINRRFTRCSISRESQVATRPLVKPNSRFAIPRYKVRKSSTGKEMLAPPAGSLPLPRWAWEPLSVPWRPGTPRRSSRSRQKARHANHTLPRVHNLSMNHTARGSSGAAMRPVAPAPAAQPEAAPGLPRVLRLQLPLPSPRQLRGHHVSCGSSSRCPARGGFGAAMCALKVQRSMCY